MSEPKRFWGCVEPDGPWHCGTKNEDGTMAALCGETVPFTGWSMNMYREHEWAALAGGMCDTCEQLEGGEIMNDRIDAWHTGDSEKPLHEFLGMTWKQYKRWMSRGAPVVPAVEQLGLPLEAANQ